MRSVIPYARLKAVLEQQEQARRLKRDYIFSVVLFALAAVITIATWLVIGAVV